MSSLHKFHRRTNAKFGRPYVTYDIVGEDYNFSNVSLLIRGDGVTGDTNFVDLSTNTKTITNNSSVTMYDAESKYGPSCINFIGDASRTLTVGASADFRLDADFTIDMWCFPKTQTKSYPAIFRINSGSEQISLYYKHASAQPNAYSLQINGTFYGSTFTTQPTLNTWHHLALTRSGNTWRLFINGVLDNSITLAGTIFLANPTVCIGDEYVDRTVCAYTGYIDDFRITKGLARWVAAFTPPSTGSTTTTTTVAPTIIPKVLLRFEGSNGSTDIGDEYGTPYISKGNAAISTAQYKFGTASAGFYGDTGNGITATALTTNSTIGINDFTVEGWVRPTATGSVALFNLPNSITTTPGIAAPSLWWTGSNWEAYINGSGQNIGTTAPTVNAWNHWAYVRSNGNVYCYLNGTIIGTAQADTRNLTGDRALNIGFVYGLSGFGGSSAALTYHDSVRFSTGAVYTANFTPPTTDFVSSVSTILLNGNGASGATTFTDSSNFARTITSTNANINTSVKKYGTGSMYFNGTTAYATTPYTTTMLDITKDFTIEGWIYATAAPTSAEDPIFCLTTSSSITTGLNLRYISGNKLSMWLNGYTVNMTTASAITLNAWHHFAFTKSGSNNRFFVDGALVSTNTTTLTAYTPSRLILGAHIIGVDWDASRYFGGYIDDFRITNGTALYTAAFTPPTAELSKI